MYIVNPEYLLYLCKLNDIKDSIARKVVEKEYLINYECKSLKVDFLLNIGTLEYKRYSLKNRINKTKRKIELLKDIEYYEINEINSMIEDEFENQNMIEKEMFDDINIAVEYSMKDEISPKKIDELNKNFSIIVRAYDPLLHKNSSSKKTALFETAKNAYANGNNRLLKNYVDLIDNEDMIDQADIEVLKEEILYYKKLLKECIHMIHIIKNSFPYDQKVLLLDDDMIRRKKESLNNENIELELELKKYEKKLEKMIG